MRKLTTIFTSGKKFFFIIGALGLLVHIIYFQSINSLFILPFLFYWMLLGFIYKLNEKFFFGIALFFLLFVPVAFLLGNFAMAEKLSVWEFLFLVLGLFQWFLFDVVFLKRKK